MDKLIVTEKLESLRRSIARVELKYRDSGDDLLVDYDVQDVISLNLTRAVQLCVDISAHIIAETEVSAPTSMSDTFVKLAEIQIIEDDLAKRMINAVGFRNLAIHSYEKINWEIVKSICKYHLDDFKKFAMEMDELLSVKD